ncbi:uncharacterized protein LOC124446735, partial [Xenia sp. Carnegie-2017]|uniref:uncharacterized protein LOC124446735 n=1 Tax=Xenia sp. Carnegie-2017 TaxID=2897299 RepID=UPI001F041DF9
GCTVEEAQKRKLEAIDILGDATFTLHKWASNAKELEEGSVNENHEEQTAAKQQFGVQPTETKILGTTWNKEKDTLSVQIGHCGKSPTKRNILSRLAKIYDPIGIASPLLLQGKQIYREVCDLKLPWDAELIGKLKQSWEKWENTLPSEVTVPRAVLSFQEPVCSLEIHGFGDASGEGLCAVVYTVAKQPSGVTQELLAAKSRLAKRGLTIPRLELVASHMAANLVSNASNALRHIPHRKHCWSDSTVALWWIKGEGDYKQFVSHRVAKIRASNEIVWHHVPTTDNPADLGSRGGKLTEMWMKGPAWLSERSLWPPDLIVKPSTDSQSEAKATRLNVQPDDDEILRCQGRIQGEFPIYLPDDALFTVKLVEDAHLETLHRGVILTMAKVRENYWVPRLRRLVKKQRKRCYRCKRFTTKPYQAPIPAPLPKTRTEGNTPYKVIGVDFAGPIKYKVKKIKKEKPI